MKYKTTNIMNREILFRGLKADGSNEWVYGNLNQLKDGTFILEKDFYGSISEPDYHSVGMGCGLEDRNITDRYEAMQYGWDKCIERQNELLPCFIEVIPSTVGQFTGLTDKNGTRIFEGDYDSNGIMVTWRNNCNGWEFAQIDIPTKDICIPCHRCDGNFFFEDHINDFEVIGNIHQK